jgi:hypothetical protein
MFNAKQCHWHNYWWQIRTNMANRKGMSHLIHRVQLGAFFWDPLIADPVWLWYSHIFFHECDVWGGHGSTCLHFIVLASAWNSLIPPKWLQMAIQNVQAYNSWPPLATKQNISGCTKSLDWPIEAHRFFKNIRTWALARMWELVPFCFYGVPCSVQFSCRIPQRTGLNQKSGHFLLLNLHERGFMRFCMGSEARTSLSGLPIMSTCSSSHNLAVQQVICCLSILANKQTENPCKFQRRTKLENNCCLPARVAWLLKQTTVLVLILKI